jgi:hypothetical protein
MFNTRSFAAVEEADFVSADCALDRAEVTLGIGRCRRKTRNQPTLHATHDVTSPPDASRMGRIQKNGPELKLSHTAALGCGPGVSVSTHPTCGGGRGRLGIHSSRILIGCAALEAFPSQRGRPWRCSTRPRAARPAKRQHQGHLLARKMRRHAVELCT